MVLCSISMLSDPSFSSARGGVVPPDGSLQAGGLMFGRYRLERVLGRGGMGIVWQARDEKLDRPVALKFLPDVLFMDPASRDELKRETRRSLELTHANIVRIHDFVEDDECAAISMEYIDGPTLSQMRVEKAARCFCPEEMTVWVADLCRALDYAHRVAGFVHRDLKPANLMVTSRGTLKIADFGIACGLHNTAALISAWNNSGGTLSYMSPQQLEGELAAVTDDVYSLGATLYELLTSKPPFYSGDVSLQIRTTSPDKISDRRRKLDIPGGEISPVWEETIAACLAKDPRERPASVREVARWLGVEPLALSLQEVPPEELTVVSRNIPPPQPMARRPAWQRPLLRKSALALGLVIVTFSASRMIAPLRPPPVPPASSLRVAADVREVSAVGSQEAPVLENSDALPPVIAPLPEPSPSPPPAAVIESPQPPSDPPRLTVETDPPGMPFLLCAGALETPEALPLRQGETPAIIEGLPAGFYRVVLSAAPWPAHSAAVQTGEQGPSAYRHTFPRGTVRVVSTPPGAEIFVGPDSVGEAPLEIPLPPGAHVLTAEFKDRTSRPRRVTVAVDALESVNFDFRTSAPSAANRPVRRPKKKVEESALTKISRSIKNLFSADKSKKR